jgi:hypothetical protein
VSGGAAPTCGRCGASLVEALTPDEVVLIGGKRIRFRRKTDFVACPRCMALYRVGDLRQGRAEQVTDRELLARGEGSPDA